MNPINPIIFELGPFEVRWYGVLIMLGVALGAAFSARLARKRGLNSEHVWNALILAVVVAIVGARLYHVFSTPADCPPDATFPCGWPYYRHHFFEAFAVWKSGGFQGLGIYGAIVGGILGVAIYAWWHKLNPLVWLDLVARPGRKCMGCRLATGDRGVDLHGAELLAGVQIDAKGLGPLVVRLGHPRRVIAGRDGEHGQRPLVRIAGKRRRRGGCGRHGAFEHVRVRVRSRQLE